MELYGYELWDDFRDKLRIEESLSITVDHGNNIVELSDYSSVSNYILSKYGAWKYVSGLPFDSAYSEFIQMWNDYKSKYRYNWGRVYDAIIAEYSPIENFDRHETIKTTDSGSDSNMVTSVSTDSRNESTSGSSTLTYNGSESVSRNDSESNTNSMTYEGKEVNTNTSSGTDNHSTEYAGSESKDSTKTDTSSNTNTKSGSEIVSLNGTHNNDKSTNYTGTETNRNTPNLNHTESVSAFNADAMSNLSKSTDSGESTNTRSFENRIDTESDSSTINDTTTTEFNNLTESINGTNTSTSSDTLTYENRKDNYTGTVSNDSTDTKEFTNRKDSYTGTVSGESTESKSFNNRNDSTNSTSSVTSQSDITSDTESKTNYGKSTDVESHLHGNIGVTTNQHMITEEIELRRYSLVYDIIDEFITKYTVLY